MSKEKNDKGEKTMKELQESMWAECVINDEGATVWRGTEEGSKEGLHEIGPLIELKADTFPVGTKITIEVPLCVECGTEDCEGC